MKLHIKIKYNDKVCHAYKLGSHVQGQGHNQGSKVESSFCNNLKLTEYMKRISSNFTQKLIIIRRYVIFNKYIPKLNVKVTISGQRSNYTMQLF